MMTISLQPFGEIVSADRTTPFSALSEEAIERVRHVGLVVLRGRKISEDEHQALTHRLGSLSADLLGCEFAGGASGFLYASNDPQRGCVVGTTGWHVDGPFLPRSGEAQAVSPSHNLLCCLSAARDATTFYLYLPGLLSELDPSLRATLAELDGLTIIAPYYNPSGPAFHLVPPAAQQLSRDHWSRRQEIQHELIFQHPKRAIQGMCFHMGRLCGFSRKAEESERARLGDQEAQGIIRRLHQQIENSGYVYQHHWREDDRVLIDNRIVAHKAHPLAASSVDEVGLRLLRRTLAFDDLRVPRQAVRAVSPHAEAKGEPGPRRDVHEL
jgi:alpha-ketoglutarate-dependent taurine dioxygenase